MDSDRSRTCSGRGSLILRGGSWQLREWRGANKKNTTRGEMGIKRTLIMDVSWWTCLG
jgi:hypothetical protein